MQAPVFHPTAAGITVAAVALAAGAPLFSEGLRALRLRRHLRDLKRVALADHPDGVVHVSGKVALESPLFAPLTGRPCAGFRLEVSSARHTTPRRVDEWRNFRLVDGTGSALVMGQAAEWDLMVTGWREVAADEALTEHVRGLLERVPEIGWLRSAGAPLRLVELALPVGATCHVVGCARARQVAEREAAAVLLRTGTDDLPLAVDVASAPAAAEPDLTLGPGEHLDFLLVSDAPPRPERLRASALRLGGLVLGPALSLAGMLYLAYAADWLRNRGGF